MEKLPKSRTEAKAVGSSRYFTGRPCKRGHIAFRWTAGALCTECNREWLENNRDLRLTITRQYNQRNKEPKAEALREWRKQNPGKVRAQWRRHDAENREKRNLNAANFRRKNPGRIKAANSKYRRSHMAKSRAWCAARKARIRQAMPSWVDASAIMRIYQECPPGMHVDHIVPLRGKNVSGLHVPWNLQYLAAIENQRKNNKMPENF